MSVGDDLIAILSSRTLLGLCALVLAGCALYWATGLNEQSAEQECRDRIDATLLVETARSLQRIEAAMHDRFFDDWTEVAAAVDLTDAEADAYERAITRRENAVAICGRA